MVSSLFFRLDCGKIGRDFVKLSIDFCSAVSIICTFQLIACLICNDVVALVSMPFVKCQDPLAGQKDAKIQNTSFPPDGSQF